MIDQIGFPKQITDPCRSSRFGAILSTLLILSWTSTALFPGAMHWWMFRVAILMLPLAIASGNIYTVHLNVFLLCWWLKFSFPYIASGPFNNLTQVALFAYIVISVPTLRQSLGWLRLGKASPKIWAVAFATIVLTAIALMAWVHLFNVDLHSYSCLLPKLAVGLSIAYGIGFSLFNAAWEETMFRGVMMEALDSAFGPGYLSIFIQALSFGASHYASGFPSGVIGSSLAFVFGLVLGMIRRSTKGMFCPWLVHVAADATIFCLIYNFIQGASK